MPRRRSAALQDFRSSIRLAEALMSRERRFPDPPSPRNIKAVQGLRGGAAVLMVAAFENFLKEVIEERLVDLTRHPLIFNPANIPPDMLFHNFHYTLERTVRGPFPDGYTRQDKVNGFVAAADIVLKGIINSNVFSDLTRSNPNSKKVRELFKSLGINDVFTLIKPEFDRRWGVPTINTFIANTLDTILARRHEVAHTAIVLNVSRVDLQTSVKFLRLLADLCDEEIAKHVRRILRQQLSQMRCCTI